MAGPCTLLGFLRRGWHSIMWDHCSKLWYAAVSLCSEQLSLCRTACHVGTQSLFLPQGGLSALHHGFVECALPTKNVASGTGIAG